MSSDVGSAKSGSSSGATECLCPENPPNHLIATGATGSHILSRSTGLCYAGSITLLPQQFPCGNGGFAVLTIRVCCDDGQWTGGWRIGRSPNPCPSADPSDFGEGEVSASSCEDPVDLNASFDTCCGNFSFHITE